MRGIDLSNNNRPDIDWAGVEFAYLKATEGDTFTDNKLAEFADQAIGHDIPFGCYHFAHPDANDATVEAAHFLQHTAVPATLPAALDIEPRGTGDSHRDPLAIMGAGPLAQWIGAWCTTVLQATGADPFVYLDRSYATALAPFTQRWPLWLATLDGTAPAVWHGWPVAIVQDGQAAGVDQDLALIPLTKGAFMALTDAEQTELLAIVRAMGEGNYAAPGMSLQWFNDKADDAVTRNLDRIVAAVVAALPAGGGGAGQLEVAGSIEGTFTPAASSPASSPTEPAPAPEPATAAVEATPPTGEAAAPG